MMKQRNGRDLRRYIAVLTVTAIMLCSLVGCTVAEGRPDEQTEVSESEEIESNEPTEPEESVGTEELADSETEDSLAEDTAEPEPDGGLSEELWREAYAFFLRNGDYREWFPDEINLEMDFFLHDIDNSSIPELIIAQPAYENIAIFTYTNKVNCLSTL